MLVKLIFIIFYSAALGWASTAFWVQGWKLKSLRDAGKNGNEKLITTGSCWISLVNAYCMHIVLVAVLISAQIQTQSYGIIYVMISSLIASIGSCTVSWFILSEHALKLIKAVKRIDTDGHVLDDFEVKKNKEIQGLKTQQKFWASGQMQEHLI
jgi:hypothetical protein